AYDLLSLSAQEAFARLRVFRIAYGAVHHSGDVSVMELHEIFTDFFEHGHIEYEWLNVDKFTNISISTYIRQLIANMITIVATALVYGGKISVVLEKGEQHSKRIRIVGEHEKVKHDIELSEILQGKSKTSDITTRNVQAFFLAGLVKRLGVNLEYQEFPNRVECTVTYVK
ncbi:MAG: hypothetical protein KDD76_04630, partial [Rickettsiales bacterium]|nr:hypothetical protein [Rickettsiales bacterium]